MDKIGFDDMGLAFIANFNRQNLDVDTIAFIQDYDRPPSIPRFAVMQEKEAYNYSGILVATSFNSAQKLKYMRPAKKYFYLWSLEWVHDLYTVDELSDIYQNDEITLIVRSEQHQNLIKSIWDKDALIIEDFNYEKFIQL